MSLSLIMYELAWAAVTGLSYFLLMFAAALHLKSSDVVLFNIENDDKVLYDPGGGALVLRIIVGRFDI